MFPFYERQRNSKVFSFIHYMYPTSIPYCYRQLVLQLHHKTPQSLLKSITILPATSPLLSCCTLSGISLMPLTSQIDFSRPLLA